MARKSRSKPAARSSASGAKSGPESGRKSGQGSERERIIESFMGLLAEKPIEEIARRGRDTLRFGPMKPTGLTDPRTGRRPYAVVQLRSENARSGSFNLVGFQNHMRFGDILQMRESTLKRFLRLPKFDEHLALHWMDASSAHGDHRAGNWMTDRSEQPTNSDVLYDLAATYNDFGFALEDWWGDASGALENHHKALSLREAFVAVDPGT